MPRPCWIHAAMHIPRVLWQCQRGLSILTPPTEAEEDNVQMEQEKQMENYLEHERISAPHCSQEGILHDTLMLYHRQDSICHENDVG